jgi:hypothetical protein
MYFACINSNQVVNVIYADQEFINSWQHGYDAVVACGDSVGIGFIYNLDGTFSPKDVSSNEEETPSE